MKINDARLSNNIDAELKEKLKQLSEDTDIAERYHIERALRKYFTEIGIK
jgi:predicted transcriptional regulator